MSLEDKIQKLSDEVLEEQKSQAETLNKLDTRTQEYEEYREEANKKMDSLTQELNELSSAVNRQYAGSEKEDNIRHELEMKGLANLIASKQFEMSESRLPHKDDDAMSEYKAMSVGNTSAGGVLVPEKLQSEVTRLQRELTPALQVSDVKSLDGTDRYEWNVQTAFAAATRVGETGSRDATDTPEFKRREIVAHELYARPQLTLQVIEDSIINLESFLSDEVSKEFAVTINREFVRGAGDGSNQFSGLNSYVGEDGASPDSISNPDQIKAVSLSNVSGSPEVLTIDHNFLVRMVHTPKPYVRQNAKWMGSRGTLESIRTITDTSGRPLYDHDYANAAGFVPYVLGFPYVENEEVGAVGQSPSEPFLYFGDFKRGYRIFQRKGMTVLPNPYSTMGQITFYFRQRIGGGLNDGNALVAGTHS